MARFDEGPTLGHQALLSIAWLAVFFIGFFVAEWVGVTTSSLFASSMFGFATALILNYLPGADASESEKFQANTLLARAFLGVRWLIVLAAVGFVTVTFLEKVESGLGYWDATMLGYLVGCFAHVIVARVRSRKLTERQFSQ